MGVGVWCASPQRAKCPEHALIDGVSDSIGVSMMLVQQQACQHLNTPISWIWILDFLYSISRYRLFVKDSSEGPHTSERSITHQPPS